MISFVIGALVCGMISVTILVVSAYRVGRNAGALSVRQAFDGMIESTCADLARAQADAVAERERNEGLAAELEMERQDRRRADDERREFASEAFNAKLEARRLSRRCEALSSDLADQWAALQAMREDLGKLDLASMATLGDITEDKHAPTTLRSVPSNMSRDPDETTSTPCFDGDFDGRVLVECNA